MKTKLFCSVLVIFISLINSYGQITKRTLMLGGELEMPFQSQQAGILSINLDPKVGYFIIDNLVMGLNLESEFLIHEDYKRTTLGAGPLMRYYVGQNKLKFFSHAAYIASIIVRNNDDQDEFQSHLQPGIGICYLLRPTVGIEAMIGYDIYSSNYKSSVTESYLSLRIGFQIFIPPLNSNYTNGPLTLF